MHVFAIGFILGLFGGQQVETNQAAKRDLTVDFTASATEGDIPLPVEFAVQSPGPIASVVWDFGDGGSSTELEPSYVYQEPGAYTVTLQVRWAVPGNTEVVKENMIFVTHPLWDSIILTPVNEEAGFTSMHTLGNTHAGGTAWVDYNGDFLADLFISNGTGLPHYLYRNEGDGTFTDQSHEVPKPDLAIEDGGVKFGDIDNDGDSDIFVFADSPEIVIAHIGACGPDPCNPTPGGPNMLYINRGDGTFIENGLAAGVVDPGGIRNNAAGFADYDRDGFLDLYVGSWALFTPISGELDNFDRMLHGDGDGTFTDVTATLGTDNYGRDSLVAMWFDIQMDGWPDLWVGNACGVDMSYAIDAVYVNQNGTGFVDAVDTQPWIGDDAIAAMGLDVGDIENDGDWDLYITDIGGEKIGGGGVDPLGNPLFLGSPDGTMSDNVAIEAGVDCVTSWPCNFVDFDRDCWIDLWVGTVTTGARDYLYLNEKDGTFEDLTPEGFLGNDSRGGSAADYDGDGDVDLALWNQAVDSVVLRNDSFDLNGWIEFKLLGQASNSDAIGATIRITTDDGITQMRRVSGGDSAHSQSELICHFGVGQATEVDVQIDWPSGAVQNFADVPTNDLVIVDENGGIDVEHLTDSQIVYNSTTQTLLVRALTSRRARTELSVDGFGPLDYDASLVRFTGGFSTPSAPASITVRSTRGGSWVVSDIVTIP